MSDKDIQGLCDCVCDAVRRAITSWYSKQRVEGSATGECPFDGPINSFNPSSNAATGGTPLSFAHLVPKDSIPDVAIVMGTMMIGSRELDDLGLLINKRGEAAYRYAIAQALKSGIRGRVTRQWLWKVAENWKPEMVFEAAGPVTAKTPWREDIVRKYGRKTLEAQAEAVF